MLERNDIGKQVRRYFIRIEEKYKQLQKPKSALQILQDAMLEVDKKIEFTFLICSDSTKGS